MPNFIQICQVVLVLIPGCRQDRYGLHIRCFILLCKKTPKYCQYIDQIYNLLLVANNVLFPTLNLKLDSNNVQVSQDKWVPQRWEK